MRIVFVLKEERLNFYHCELFWWYGLTELPGKLVDDFFAESARRKLVVTKGWCIWHRRDRYVGRDHSTRPAQYSRKAALYRFFQVAPEPGLRPPDDSSS